MKNNMELLEELKRLANADTTNDFQITFNIENLPREEQESARLIELILDKYKAVVESDLTKYRLTADVLGIAPWDMDVLSSDPVSPDNKFTWSQGIRQMLGFSDGNDFSDTAASWLSRLHPDDKGRVLGALATHLSDRSKTTPYNVKYRMMTKSGE